METAYSRMVIVPDYIAAEIDARLDDVLSAVPDAEKDREALRSQLLSAFDQYGFIPEFSIEKTA